MQRAFLIILDSVGIGAAPDATDYGKRSTDPCREFVPLLVYAPTLIGNLLGIRKSFYDVAQSLATWCDSAPVVRGKSFVLPPHLRNNEREL
jgi:phosphopentomutase